jgi:hypothetical protein
MAFTGDAQALRAWAARTGLPELPDPARAAFLRNAPGKAFDATNGQAKLALVSSDDGLCAAVTDTATRTDLTRALEAGFAQAGLKFRLVIERDDKAESSIHHQEYLATRKGRGWRVLAATVREGTGQAMLTAAPE